MNSKVYTFLFFILQISNQRKALSDCWLSLLNQNLPDDVYKLILADMRSYIIPNVVLPLRLSDFLIDSYNMGMTTYTLQGSSILYRR